MVTRLRPTDDQNTGKEASGARHGGPRPPLSVCGRLRPKDDHKFKVHLSGTVSYRLALRYRVNLCPNPKTKNQRIIHLKPRPNAVVRQGFMCKGWVLPQHRGEGRGGGEAGAEAQCGEDKA